MNLLLHNAVHAVFMRSGENVLQASVLVLAVSRMVVGVYTATVGVTDIARLFNQTSIQLKWSQV